MTGGTHQVLGTTHGTTIMTNEPTRDKGLYGEHTSVRLPTSPTAHFSDYPFYSVEVRFRVRLRVRAT